MKHNIMWIIRSTMAMLTFYADEGEGGGSGDGGGDGSDGSGHEAGASADQGAADESGSGTSTSEGGGSGDSGGSGENIKPFYQSMPEDWRKQTVDGMGLEGDAATKQMKAMERFTDLPSMVKAMATLQDKQAKGMIEVGLPENATDEQVSEYRELNGIPATAADYDVKLADGLVMGQEDSDMVGFVAEVAHKDNISNDVFSNIANAAMFHQQKVIEGIQKQDGIDKQITTQQLKEAWGGDYTANHQSALNALQGLPDAVREGFMSARFVDEDGFPSGVATFNHPEVLVWLADLQRRADPAGTVVPNANNPTQAITTEIAALEKRMGEPGWHKDVEANDRYLQLINAQNNMKK